MYQNAPNDFDYDEFELMVQMLVQESPNLGRILMQDKDSKDLLQFLGMV
jgi:hypothetical protein